MTSSINTLRLDMRDNPDLKAALGGLQPGDSASLEFDLTVKSIDDETFEATIEGITYESDDTESTDGKSEDDMMSDEEDTGDKTSKSGDTITPSADEPVMVVMLGKNSKKNAKSAPAEEDAA